MTPEELEELVLTARNGEEMRLAFKGLDEKARKKLSTTASALQRQLWEGKAKATASERLKEHLSRRKGENYQNWNSRAVSNASLAVFALGPLSAVKKWQIRPSHEDRKAFRSIIVDRRPDWLDDWIAHEMEAEWSQLEFPTIRSWVRDSIIAKPTADGYYRIFAWHLMRTGFYGAKEDYVPPLSKQLLDDPDLLDDIEGLFRVETNAFNTNSWLVKGAPDHHETWPQALIKLAEGGHYDRGKLLDLSLAGLQADIKQNQLSGYHKFFKQLAPETQELATRQQALIALLCHPVGHVAKFAIDMLGKLESAKLLDDAQALRELPNVFSGEGKGNAMAALRLIEKVIKRTIKQNKGNPSADALAAAIEGLRHANGDVQAKAITLLETHSDHLAPPHWRDIESFAAFVAASNRASLASLLEGAGDAVDASAIAVPAADPAELEAYQAKDLTFLTSRVLSDETRLNPVATLDELIDLAFHCVEVVDHADEIERLLDGLSRMADQRPADFHERVDPLVHRLKKRETGAHGLGVAYPGVGENMRALLLTWATGRLRGSQKRDLTYYSLEDAFVPIIAHLHALSQRVHRQEAFQLLSSATHQHGWIDPLVWAQRLQLARKQGPIPDSMDFRLSLLRLAPDNRAEALAALQGLAGDAGRIARFALGGDEAPQRADRQNYSAWVCAARARDPMADWSEAFASLAVDDNWPGGVSPAAYRWESRNKAESYQDTRWKVPILDVKVARADGRPAPTGSKPSGLLKLGKALAGRKHIDWRDLPVAAVHRQQEGKYAWSSELNTSWVAQYLYYIWPQGPAYAYFRGASRLLQRMDENASNWTPSHGFFNALFVRGRSWGEAGHLLLVLGLIGKDADAKGLANDALIEGIETRQFDPALFADVMARITAGEWVKYNRLGESLKQVVQVSSLHAAAIGEALQRWLPHFDLKQRNAFHILEAFGEAQAMVPLPLSDDVRQTLGALSGSSKSARLAKQLLA